jgi:hypothetical protein
MKFFQAIALLLLPWGSFVAGALGQSAKPLARAEKKQPAFDLSKVNDKPWCEDKGRLQDYPSKTMDQIIAGGKESIPVLISMLTDKRSGHNYEIICFWGEMSIQEIAYCVLMDLFTDSQWTHFTIPGVSEEYFLGPTNKDEASWSRLREYIHKHGSRSLQRKWEDLWRQYGDRIFWDAKERCFKVAEALH